MRFIKNFLAAALVMVASAGAFAQDCCQSACCGEAKSLGYKPYPYGFVQLQGGVGTTFTNVKFTDLISPTASVGVGYMFAPQVGARLHVNAWESKGGFLNVADKYKFNYVNTNLDLMLNLTNIVSKKVNHLFNLYLIGGVGLNYAWGNDDFVGIVNGANPAESTCNAWAEGLTPRESLLGHNIRAGLLCDFNLSKHWNVGLEVDANSLDDRFNSKYNNSDDWMVTAQLSVTYKFGHKKMKCNKPVAPVEPVVAPEPTPEPVVTPEPEPTPAPVVVEDEPLRETIFYAIRMSDPERFPILQRVLAWSKKYPNKKISVDGYADKGTGNPTLNVGYAKARAEKVKNELIQMGVPASQLVVKSYGDTVQPFAENDKNRCVIIVGQ